ncbi:hypothetical protein [Bradyrhizobium genosp. P]|uniref:hypothetical protein n=1 Tax=Bradyrhizobium genosp. P TaxID=83641 RepID=UPI003CEAC7F3
MPKVATRKSTSRVKRSAVSRHAKTGKIAASGGSRFAAIMTAAEHSGLLGEKRARIAGRISPELIHRAKQQTGIATDTDLIEFALASVALDDNFGETFRKTMGSVDPDLKLGF